MKSKQAQYCRRETERPTLDCSLLSNMDARGGGGARGRGCGDKATAFNDWTTQHQQKMSTISFSRNNLLSF